MSKVSTWLCDNTTGILVTVIGGVCVVILIGLIAILVQYSRTRARQKKMATLRFKRREDYGLWHREHDRFLCKLFEMVDGDESKVIDGDKIAKALGFGESTGRIVIKNLKNEDLISVSKFRISNLSFGPRIKFTHDGFKKAEGMCGE